MTSSAIIPNSPSVECSKIADGLYMGSRPVRGPWVRVRGFNVLVLTACDFQPPAADYPGVEVGRVPIDDATLLPDEALAVTRMARIIASRIRRGDKILITCNHGRNRSGLVTALTLARLAGCSGIEAALQVKANRRSPFGEALTNASFIEYLMKVPRSR